MMAGRQPPKRLNYTSQLMQGMQDLVGAPASAQELAKVYTATQKYCDQLGAALVKTSAESSKRIAANTTQSIDSIIGEMEKKTDESLKRADDRLQDFVNSIYQASGKINRKLIPPSFLPDPQPKKKAPKPESESSDMLKLLHELTHKGKHVVWQDMVGAIKEIGSHLTRIAPQLAAIASVGLALKLVIDKVFELDEAIGKLSMVVGGNYEVTKKYHHELSHLVETTNLSKEELLELGKAFAQAGMGPIKHFHQVEKYMEVAGNLTRIFGVSNQEIARYVRTLKQSGMTAEEVMGRYDDLYQSMQRWGLTLNDLRSSMSEGDALWSEFGSISGKTMDQVQKDILETKGVFRSFNIDIKNTGSLLAGMWGDPKIQQRQAGLIASMMKIRGSSAYNELILNPQKGMEHLIKSSVKFMDSFSGTQFGKPLDQLEKELGSDRVTGIIRMRQALMGQLSEQFKIPQEMLSQAVSDFSAWRVKNPGKSIDEWSASRLSKGSGKSGSIQDALGTLNNTIDETFKRVSNWISEMAEHVAYFVLEIVPPMMRWMNSILEVLKQAVGWIPGLTKSISTLVFKTFDEFKSDKAASMAASSSNKAYAPPPTWLPPPVNIKSLPAISGGMLDSKALNEYRKAQGLGQRGLHADFWKNAAAVLQIGQRKGADMETIKAAIATMIQESGGRTDAAGDYGVFRGKRFIPKGAMRKYGLDPSTAFATSFGPFQEHTGGRLGKLPPSAAMNIFDSSERAFNEFMIYRKNHPTWSRGQLAAAAQRPADQAGYRRSIDSMNKFVDQVVARLSQTQTAHLHQETNEYLKELVEVTKKDSDKRDKAHQEMKLKAMTSNPALDMQRHYLHNSIA